MQQKIKQKSIKFLPGAPNSLLKDVFSEDYESALQWPMILKEALIPTIDLAFWQKQRPNMPGEVTTLGKNQEAEK